MADIDELLRQYENVGNPTGQQPSWSSPFAFLGSAPRSLPPIMEQARTAHGNIGTANPYEMALAMAMGPKAPMRPTAGATAASPRQVAMEKGQEAFNATGPSSSQANWREFHSPSGVNDPHSLKGAIQREVFPEMMKAQKRIDRLLAKGLDPKSPEVTQAIDRYHRMMEIYYGKPGAPGPQRTDDPFYRAATDFARASPPPANRLNAVGPAIAAPGILQLLSQLYGDEAD